MPQDINERLKDFRYFLFLIWRHLDLPDPTPIQVDIAAYLQHGPKRKVIEAFRGVGKSWITAAYVLYRLYHNPQLKILVVSASKERADNFSTFTLRLINDVPWLAHLAPKQGQRNSKISFDVGPAKPDQSPSVKSVGLFGQLTGSRADIIIADDVETPMNSYTQGMRDKLREAVKEFDAILKPDPGTEITYLGTPQTAMSLYNVLGERGYHTRIWPARVPNDELRAWYGKRLAKIISQMEDTGKSTDPKRFSDRDLAEREASYGRSGFALQFMLDTSLSDAEKFPLRTTDFTVMNLNPDLAPEKIVWAAEPQNKINDLPNMGFDTDAWYSPMALQGEWRPYDMSVMFIDPSGRGADATAWVILKSQGVNLYLVSAGGHRMGYSDMGMALLQSEAKKYKVNYILVESNFGDGMFTQLMKPFFTEERGYACTIEEVRSNKQKELRIIDTLEPLMNQHRIIVDRSVIEKDYNDTQELVGTLENGFAYSLFYQLTHITKDRGSLVHDDQLDAFAGCAAKFVELMSADQDVLMEIRKEEDIEADALIFLTETDPAAFDLVCLGHQPKDVIQKLGITARHGKKWTQA
ncbi:phage terminase large subunit [Cloacibacillus porcorum]|uniref:phage terminase large subunit n=1 Tax=Cloacibacillus porcorum TaxID=1197717 RepID=UPI0014592598|nr:phage terminase large subunit [Cloacibacillus porcorum]NMF18587.1 phage terminase large subunit [Cloacibacillus porcorum]